MEPITTVDAMYPIYLVSAKWTEDASENSRPEDIIDGRIKNNTGFSIMLREPDLQQAEAKASEWWEQYKEKRTNPKNLGMEVTLERNESWCGGWFSHWTFDVGQTDAEALASFSRFVDRMESLNCREGKWKPWSDGSDGGYMDYPVSLMGAEDRWRWTARPSGTGVLGFGFGEETAPPCRCEGCKKQGILRIDH